MVAFRILIPLYMVMALSQFITYLLILIVGEKENKIKEGMKIMGLRDSVFWLVLHWRNILGMYNYYNCLLQVVVVYYLRSICLVFDNSMLCVAIYPAGFPEHQLYSNILLSFVILLFYNNVWIHDNTVIRQIQSELLFNITTSYLFSFTIILDCWNLRKFRR